MASKAFIDPKGILRLVPLVSTTASVWFAYDEHFFLSTFLVPKHRQLSNKILPSYFSHWFYRGIFVILGLNGITIASAVTNIFKSSGSQKMFYSVGLGFTLAHFLFGALIAYPIRDIIEDRSQGNSTKDLEKWLRIHRIRVFLADLPGWLSFICAAGGVVI